MSRLGRLSPFLFAGVVGVVSGVYIFRPILEDVAAAQELRRATKEEKSLVQQEHAVNQVNGPATS